MPYDLKIPKFFWDSAKLVLNDYPKAKSDIYDLLEHLSLYPETGVIVPGYEGKIRKIRGQLKGYNEGKRGGLRIIYYYGGLIAPLFIYSKRQMADAPKEIIQRMIALLQDG